MGKMDKEEVGEEYGEKGDGVMNAINERDEMGSSRGGG